MHKWLQKILFRKKLEELDNLKKQLDKITVEARKAKYFAIRTNTICIDLVDLSSPHAVAEVSAIWRSSEFQFLLHLTRNELIAELISGGDAAIKNVPGMLKGLEALALKMQNIARSTEMTVPDEEV